MANATYCWSISAINVAVFSVFLLIVPAVNAADHPSSNPDAWTLVFEEQFDGDVLNVEDWTTCYWWDTDGCTNEGNNELQWYQPDNVSVEDGNLVLEAKEQHIHSPDGVHFDYSSGMVTTGRTDPEARDGDRFSLTWGYVEVRAHIPSGAGLWPAVWLLPSDHTSVPEIDIMEVLGGAPDTLEMHYHSRVDGDEQSDGADAIVGDLSEDFHTYAVDWSPEAIIWLLDGEEVCASQIENG